MRRIYATLRRAAATLIGIVLFISGFLKLMDPVGIGLIVSEYYNFFGVDFFITAKALGFILSMVETVTAIALLTGVFRKITAIVSGALLAFFTLVTIILSIKNPAMDCGCFGQAIHLTHTQSLVKNIVLVALWTLSYVPFKNFGNPKKIKYVTFTLSVILMIVFGVISIRNIPLNDHTPYSSGTELISAETPFSFSNAQGEYCDSLLFGDGIVLISIYDPDKADMGSVLRFVEEIRNHGFTPLVIVSDPRFLEYGDDFYWGDRRSLMTVNRSNGGATYISDGQIIRKWSARHLPSEDDFQKMMTTDPSEIMIGYNSFEKISSQLFALFMFALMLLL